jgi:hypothetical protein
VCTPGGRSLVVGLFSIYSSFGALVRLILT